MSRPSDPAIQPASQPAIGTIRRCTWISYRT